MPHKISYRNKMGFGIPLRGFFKDQKFKEYLTNDIFQSLQNRNLFNKIYLKNLFNNIDNLNFKEMDTLWVLITLEIWVQEFIDKQGLN